MKKTTSFFKVNLENKKLKNVFYCAGDKAPGPDGFTMAFFIHCWDVVKVEVIAAIQNFHSQGYFEKSFNATFIALIPKKMGNKIEGLQAHQPD
uniref:Putative ovule protein n=1 Tax=Solanum chacoense TaxID=4108 RepID=A0A0V0GX57_SOLCH